MMKHQVIINVVKENGEKSPVVKGSIRTLPARIVKWLFGEYTQVYLLKPGETVSSVDVVEVIRKIKNTVPPMGTLNEPFLLQSSLKCGILSP